MKKEIKQINTVEDLEGLKTRNIIQYTCKGCGKLIQRQYRPERKAIISRMLCYDCNVVYTNRERHGVDYPAQNKEIYAKVKATNRKKYGCENSMQNKEVRAKAEATNLAKYGNKCSLHGAEVQEKVKESLIAHYGVDHPFKSKEIQEKARQSMVDRHGAPTTLQSETLREKVKATNKARYNVEFPLQSKEIRDKSEAAFFSKYGVGHPMHVEEIKEKVKQSMMDKYGVEYSTQSKEIRDKMKQNSLDKYGMLHPPRGLYLYDGEKFDSSWELALWIYAKDHGEPIERATEPFEYIVDGKVRYYYPDFIYKGEIVEVKGSQFMNNGTMINPFDSSQNDAFFAKQQCAIDHGVKFMYQEDMMPYINYCRMKFAYKTWYHMYTAQYMWLQWLYNYSFMYDFTPFSTNVFEREGMEFVDCEDIP